MNNPKLASPTEVTRLLTKYDFRCKKRLGQNFLVDQNTLQIIINSLKLNKKDRILEIGTGIGTLTSALSPLVKQVVSVEKDKKLAPLLKESLSSSNNIEIIFEDIMNFDLVNFFEKKRTKSENIEKVVGNLPYYISISLIRQILELSRYIKLAVFLIQKEVGERLMSQQGIKIMAFYLLLPNIILNPKKCILFRLQYFIPN